MITQKIYKILQIGQLCMPFILSIAPPKPVQCHCSVKTLIQGLGVTGPRKAQRLVAHPI